MRPLDIKLIRDLREFRWQYLAIGVMVSAGVMLCCGSYMVYQNLEGSYNASYRLLRFEDFGVAFNDAPERVVNSIRSIPGVSAAEGRLIEDVQIELRGPSGRKAVGRLIGIPGRHRPTINDLKLVSGRYLRTDDDPGVLLERSFAAFHRLGPGATLVAKHEGSRYELTVAGVVESAEYIYVVRSKQELIPFPDTFGVMFVSGDVLGPLVGKQGQINEVRALVEDPTQLDRIMRQAKAALAAYRPDDAIPREEIRRRTDLRELLCFTIDPEDAKDFDDALSVQRLPNGNLRFGIHIADVSHYVKPGSPLDTEAKERGNSTYLVGTVIPMLPHALSSGLCSLVEAEDRLVKSVICEFSPDARLLRTEFANGVIRSRKRLTYKQAYAFMQGADNAALRAMPAPPPHQTGSPGRPLAELTDPAEERARLSKELAEAESQIARLEKQIGRAHV